MAQPGAQAEAKTPVFDEEEIADLAAFVASLGPGPAIPDESDYSLEGMSETEREEAVARGGQIFLTNCTACHNFKLVAAQGLSRSQWDDSLTWMTTRHNMADIQGADRALILDYLEKHYPPRAPSRAGGWRNPFAPQ